MMEKVKDLYDFLCINYEDGDEVRSLPLFLLVPPCAG